MFIMYHETNNNNKNKELQWQKNKEEGKKQTM